MVNGRVDTCSVFFLSYYLELLSSVHLSGPELWRVDE